MGRRPPGRPRRVLDLREEAAPPRLGPEAPPEVRVAFREGALPASIVVAIQELWPATWVIPTLGRRPTIRLLTEFPPDVLVLPADASTAPLAADAREALPSLHLVAVAPGNGGVEITPDWAEVTLPADAQPTLWMLAVMGLGAAVPGSAKWGWVQMVLKAVDSAYRGLLAVEADPDRPAQDVAELRRRVERYFEVLMRLILDQAERDLEGFAGRSFRIAELSRRIAVALHLPPEEIEAARLAGLLHDVGMHLVVSSEALGRPGPLKDEEWARMRSHPDASVAATAPLGRTAVSAAIMGHHERLDGSGYPRGTKGDEVSLGARIVAVADAYDAMIHPRPHRPPLAREEVIKALFSQAEEGVLDADIVRALSSLGVA